MAAVTALVTCALACAVPTRTVAGTAGVAAVAQLAGHLVLALAAPQTLTRQGCLSVVGHGADLGVRYALVHGDACPPGALSAGPALTAVVAAVAAAALVLLGHAVLATLTGVLVAALAAGLELIRRLADAVLPALALLHAARRGAGRTAAAPPLPEPLGAHRSVAAGPASAPRSAAGARRRLTRPVRDAGGGRRPQRSESGALMNVAVPATGAPGQSPGAVFRRSRPWLSLAARLVLAVVFAVAGWPKLLDPDGTIHSVRAFRLVPEAFVPAFGYGLPVLELALALLLLVGLLTRPAAAVTGVLLVMFMVGIAAAWARGLTHRMRLLRGLVRSGRGPGARLRPRPPSRRRTAAPRGLARRVPLQPALPRRPARPLDPFLLEISVTNARTAKSAREQKAAELRAQAARKEARRRTLLVSGVVAVIVLLVVGITVIVRQAQHEKAVATASAPAACRRHLQSDGGIVSVTGAPPTGQDAGHRRAVGGLPVPGVPGLRVRQQRAAGGMGQAGRSSSSCTSPWRSSTGRRRRTTRPGRSSRRPPSSTATPRLFTAFHDLLYANQPAEGSAGLTDTQLADLAAQAGASRDAVASALSSQRFKGWTVQRTEAFTKRFTGTPTVLVDGKEVKGDGSETIISPATLKAAVAAAATAKGLPALR